MNPNNRKCICCGKEFYYCPRCGKSDKNTGVSMNYDTNECVELANAISGYSMNMWGKDKVKVVLNKYNITDYTKYKQSIQDKLNEMFPVNNAEVLMNSPVETKEVNEVQDTNEATTEQKENEIPEEVKPQRKRKSRKKKVVLSDETEKREQSNDGDNLEK